MQPFQAYYAAAAALAGAILALAIYHVLAVAPALRRLRAVLDAHDELLAGGAGSGAARRLAALEALAQRVGALEGFAATDLSRCGFTRYDAFSDAGSGLSYALALLNRRGDGVVLTSIYSRSDTRTYGKPVEGFAPAVHASAEELEAIERARSAPP